MTQFLMAARLPRLPMKILNKEVRSFLRTSLLPVRLAVTARHLVLPRCAKDLHGLTENQLAFTRQILYDFPVL